MICINTCTEFQLYLEKEKNLETFMKTTFSRRYWLVSNSDLITSYNLAMRFKKKHLTYPKIKHKIIFKIPVNFFHDNKQGDDCILQYIQMYPQILKKKNHQGLKQRCLT